jgi:hypothetical protein
MRDDHAYEGRRMEYRSIVTPLGKAFPGQVPGG